MTSTKASVVTILWALLFVSSVALAPFYHIMGGVAIGSLVTAVALLLAVKWSIEDMMFNMMDEVEQMEEALSENYETVFEQKQED